MPKKIPTKPKPIDPIAVALAEHDEYIENNRFLGEVVIPHHLTYAAVWQAVAESYLTRDDEAKRHNYQNALAMRRDAFILKMLRARQYPTVELPFTIEVEDMDDTEQKRIARELTLMVNAIPKFQYLKLNLLEAIWFGKAGVQIEWNYVNVGGERRLIPVSHIPVNGDKLVFKWDGTPGVLVYVPFKPEGADIEKTNWGPALYLYDEFYRDRFIIHEFEPDDMDYLFESDLAGGVHGVGLRSRIYWVYQIRHQILGWITDGLQRISTNGLLVGTFPTGNLPAQEAITKALTDLIAKGVTVFPRDQGGEQITGIESIAPHTVAYDTQMTVVKYFDDIMQGLVLGQSLSSGTEGTGMGSEVADLHALTLERIIRYDAQSLSETLTKDLLKPMIKYNFGELNFQVKFKLQVEKTNVKDQMMAAKVLFDMGVPLDAESLRDMAGFISPRDADTAVLKKPGDDFRVGDSDKVGDMTTKTDLPDVED